MNKSSLKWNFLYNSFYQILQIIIPLITTPYLSRTLGVENIGVYSYAYNIAHYFVLFAMLGIVNYGKRTIAMVRDDAKKLSVTFWSLYSMQLMTSIFVLFCYLYYAVAISNDIISYIMIFYVISAALDINWFFFGMEQFKITVTRSIVIKLLTTISIFVFVKNANDLYIYALIMSISLFISQIVLWSFLKGQVSFIKVSFYDIRKHFKHNLRFFVTVISVSIYKSMDKIMLGNMANMEQLGFYESSEKIIVIPIALVTSLGTVMLPRISNMVSNGDNRINQYINKSIVLSMFFSTSISFGIMGVADEFVPLFYGENFEECIVLFKILLPSCIFIAFGNVLITQYILPNKKEYIQIQAVTLGAIVNFMLNLLLISNFHARGVAIGTLCTEFLVCAYQMIRVRKYLPIKKYMTESIPFLFSGITMFCILQNIQLNTGNAVVELILKVVLGVLIYFISLLGWIWVSQKLQVDLIDSQLYQETVRSFFK